jgi:hypothetical protein
MTKAEFGELLQEDEPPICSRADLIRRFGPAVATRSVGGNKQTWYWNCKDGEVRVRIEWRLHPGRQGSEIASIALD